MAINPKGFRNYLPLTVLLMAGLATLGALWGATATTTALMSSAMVMGPLALITTVPLALATASFGNLFALVATPVWAILGGQTFAGRQAWAAANNGSHPLGVTLFADTHPIHQHLNHFARQLDLPRIKWVGWFPDDSINAFAMGLKQDEALVAFSSGAINKLTKDEMQAVMAHELAHIANHDMARMTYAVAVQDALTWFLRWRGLKQFARWVFTPLSELELMRMSRRREYWADAIGARLVSPEAMAGALRKTSALKTNSKAAADFRHFMLNADASSFFASHPTTKQRIEAIERRMFINRLPETGVASSDVDLGGVAARLKTWVYRRFNEPPHKPS